MVFRPAVQPKFPSLVPPWGLHERDRARRTFLLGGYEAPSTPTEFFGQISMLREFWAEDPNWTDPGDGNSIPGPIIDNGTAGNDMTLIGSTGTIRYREAWAGLNNKPAWDFSPTATKAFRTTSTTTSGDFCVFVVVDILGLAQQNTFTDAGTANNAFVSSNSSDQWRAYNNGGALQPVGGTADTDPHLLIVHFKTNDTTYYVDGTPVATDASGTLAAATGFTLGANYAATAGGNFVSPYAGMYQGDLLADAGYSDWSTALYGYYGI